MPKGSADRWPADYERGRPGWPPDIARVGGLPSDATVLDLGAGTGKITRLLVGAFSRVVAVEPSEAMRRVLKRLCPQAEALPGSAEDIPLPVSSVDGIFVGQAFHNFDQERAVREMARVLRPGGAAVLAWNLPSSPWQPSTAEAEEVLKRLMPADLDYIPLDLGGPDASSGWQPTGSRSFFGSFRATVFSNPHKVDREGLIAFYATMGWLAELPDHERLPLLDQVRARLPAAEYRRLWETHAHWAHRRAT